MCCCKFGGRKTKPKVIRKKNSSLVCVGPIAFFPSFSNTKCVLQVGCQLAKILVRSNSSVSRADISMRKNAGVLGSVCANLRAVYISESE